MWEQRLLLEGAQFPEWAALRRTLQGLSGPHSSWRLLFSTCQNVSPPLLAQVDLGRHSEDQGRRFRKLSDRLPLSLDILSRLLPFPFPGGSFKKPAKSGRSPEVSVWRDWRSRFFQMKSKECLSWHCPCSLGWGSPNKQMDFVLVCFLQRQRKVPSTTGYKQDALPSSHSHSWRISSFELYLKIHMLGELSWWGRVV